MALQSMGFDKHLLVHVYHAFLSFCFAFIYILILGNIVESPTPPEVIIIVVISSLRLRRAANSFTEKGFIPLLLPLKSQQ